jgi:hypothetical protein
MHSIGAFIIDKIVKATRTLMNKYDFDPTLKNFRTGLLKYMVAILFMLTLLEL